MKKQYVWLNITDGHTLLWAEPRCLEHSGSANVHLLPFPDVPLCLHVRTAGEAVTETLPPKQSRGKEELRKSVTEKLHQEFNPLTKWRLKTQTCCWTKLLTQFKLLMCPANNGWSDPRPENHLNINMDIFPLVLVSCTVCYFSKDQLDKSLQNHQNCLPDGGHWLICLNLSQKGRKCDGWSSKDKHNQHPTKQGFLSPWERHWLALWFPVYKLKPVATKVTRINGR